MPNPLLVQVRHDDANTAAIMFLGAVLQVRAQTHMLVRKVADRMIQIKICIHHTCVLTQVANETQSGFFFARQRRTGTNLSHGGTSAHYLRYGLVLVHG